MESEFQFHGCQVTVQCELKELVQQLFVLELLHKIWNLNLHEGVQTLCMLGFGLQNHHPRQEWFCGSSHE